MPLKKQLLYIFILIMGVVCADQGFADPIKSDHFILDSSPSNSYSLNNSVLRKSEYYYDKITRRLGFSRYKNFWTWDDRVLITLYANQEAFVKHSNLPDWSLGGARYGQHFSKGRSIVTYGDQEGFIDGILPHEITHLILRDFIGYDKQIPLWFDEGVAQLFEVGKKEKALQTMRNWVKTNEPIPFAIIFNYDIRFETDPLKVSIYYIQSLTMIDYLITIYGNSRFSEMCQRMKDGEPYQSAFLGAYKNIFDSMQEFEKKWLSYMKTSTSVVY